MDAVWFRGLSSLGCLKLFLPKVRRLFPKIRTRLWILFEPVGLFLPFLNDRQIYSGDRRIALP
jgi:hypothetical protein